MKKNILVLILCWIGFNVSAQNRDFSLAKKLQTAEYLIQRLYVDSVDEKALVESAIRGMLATLDPHSTYSTPEEVKRFKESMEGEFVGIGIQYQVFNDTIYVVKVFDNGPSAKAGLIAGDRIVKVNDIPLSVDRSSSAVSKLLRGEKGSKLTVGVLRDNDLQEKLITIRRGSISVSTLEASYMLTSQIGYIQLDHFGKNTYNEFIGALKQLEKQNMTSLILDLRGNNGGLLNIAVDIANEFLKAKERIVYAQGKSVDLGSFYARGNARFKHGRLAILQDEASASASEILAGAIQDWDRGLIIGRRSFGKGLVQRPIDLNDGSMIRLTIARYFTPSGRYIQRPYDKGSEGKLSYRKDLLDRLDRGELVHADSIHHVDSLQFYTLKNHRVVYGGGGIMPDIFVPVNSFYLDKDFQKILRSTVYQKSYLDYISEHRKALLSSYTKDQFIDSYTVPAWLTKKVVGDIKRQDINQEVNRILKALISRSLFGDETYYKLLNGEDIVIKKAVEIIESGRYLQFLDPTLL